MTDPAVDGVCAGCGFDYDADSVTDVVAALIQHTDAVADTVVGAGDAARMRPDVDTWSAVEYGCHVRDVLAVQRGRIALALADDRPDFVPMGREQLVVDRQYNAQDPGDVAAELRRESAQFADAARALSAAELLRVGTYNYPVPTERSLEWLVRHTGHEVQHHRDDIARGLTRS